MLPFQIVAHRGVPGAAPANTLPAFARAVELGADAVELDVRLTRDGVPVVSHYIYLDDTTSGAGPLFAYSAAELEEIEVRGPADGAGAPIPTLAAVLEAFAGRIGLEIELKGPEPEAAACVGALLAGYRPIWDTLEITSYEPALLQAIRQTCPGVAVDLLFPRSEPWMRPDAVAYLALHRARLAGARAVHLQPSQLTPDVVRTIRAGGVEIHAWDANDLPALETILELGIPRICTDRFLPALHFRTQQAIGSRAPGPTAEPR